MFFFTQFWHVNNDKNDLTQTSENSKIKRREYFDIRLWNILHKNLMTPQKKNKTRRNSLRYRFWKWEHKHTEIQINKIPTRQWFKHSSKRTPIHMQECEQFHTSVRYNVITHSHTITHTHTYIDMHMANVIRCVSGQMMLIFVCVRLFSAHSHRQRYTHIWLFIVSLSLCVHGTRGSCQWRRRRIQGIHLWEDIQFYLRPTTYETITEWMFAW